MVFGRYTGTDRRALGVCQPVLPQPPAAPCVCVSLYHRSHPPRLVCVSACTTAATRRALCVCQPVPPPPRRALCVCQPMRPPRLSNRCARMLLIHNIGGTVILSNRGHATLMRPPRLSNRCARVLLIHNLGGTVILSNRGHATLVPDTAAPIPPANRISQQFIIIFVLSPKASPRPHPPPARELREHNAIAVSQ